MCVGRGGLNQVRGILKCEDEWSKSRPYNHTWMVMSCLKLN